MSVFDEILEMKKQYKEKLSADGKAMLQKHFLEFFEKFPEAEAVRWTQYTPYFNDGDACVFGVNEFTYKKVGDSEGGDYEDGFHDSYGKDRPEFMKTKLGAIPSDVLEAVFGDHVQITATRDGFAVEEYEHD